MKHNDAATRFLEISPYLSTPADLQAPLSGEVRVDVAIVGGGYVGLSTALALKKAGVSVAIIEREFCGFGASGRNAGHLTPTICKDVPTALMLFGKETAAKLARFADECVHNAENMMHEYGIECDYHPSGNIMTVVHPSQEKRLREATEVASGLGAKMRFIESGEMRERGLHRNFLCGALEEVGGTLNPGKLVQGMRRAALKAGVSIFEKSPVRRISYNPKPLIETDRGSIKADKVLLAANAYLPEMGMHPGKYLVPLYDTQMETEPLTDAQLAAIGGWKGREGIYTAHESMESFRLTAQRTILGGSKDVRYFFGSEVTRHGGDQDCSKLSNIKVFRERFPELADVRIAHSWSGWVDMTLNFLPIVGQNAKQPAQYFCAGFNGHGIAQGTSMGNIMADLMLGRPNPWHELIIRKPIWIPPEPLRWLLIKGMLTVINGIDRHYDKQLRKQAARNQR
jgi:gamma-glutamylputrescine oxidase